MKYMKIYLGTFCKMRGYISSYVESKIRLKIDRKQIRANFNCLIAIDKEILITDYFLVQKSQLTINELLIVVNELVI